MERHLTSANTLILDFTIGLHIDKNAGLGKVSLGRWLGVSHKVGQLMSYWILPDTGKVISCTTVQRLINLEQSSPEWNMRMNKFNQAIEEKVVNIKDSDIPVVDVPQWNRLSLDENDEEFNKLYISDMDNEAVKEPDDPSPADDYINMKVELARKGHECIERATVKR